MNGQNENHTQSQHQQGFNCVLSGIGYLNPSQWVEPTKGDAYRVAKLSLLEGQDGKNTIKCDCIISDRAAENLDFIEDLVAQYEGEVKVICSVRIGVKGINTFNKSNGELGTSIRGRLIRITSVSINGDRYDLPDAKATAGDGDQAEGEPAGNEQSGEEPNQASQPPMPAAKPKSATPMSSRAATPARAAPAATRPQARMPARAAQPMPRPMPNNQSTGHAARAPQGRMAARPVPARASAQR